MKKLGLYIHIPFCKKKCNYCDFYSLCNVSEEKIDDYIDALRQHIKKEGHVYENCLFDTVFLGGGTPGILSSKQFVRLLDGVKQNLNIAKDAEFTVETNPGTLDKEKLLTYRKWGVNRLSIGLQSAKDNELSVLGRIHTFDVFEKSYNLARLCGFDNISVDIMYGLPNQKKEDLVKTIDRVCDFSPEHISAYCLKIEDNTPFGRQRDTLSLPSDEEEYEMYMTLCERLGQTGYCQYEISNFAKKGYRSKHNIKYWQSEEYVGFGPSSHSYFDGVRYSYSKDLDEYISQSKKGIFIKLTEENEDENGEKNNRISAKIDKMDEYVMLKLRLSDGICEKEFFNKFNLSFIEEYPRVLGFVKSGYMKYENGAYSFTPQGFFVSNYIYTEILHF